MIFLPKLGIIQSLLQNLNEKCQNILISTLIFIVSVCVIWSLELNSLTKL